MTRVTFQDFYGQEVIVHDETASGNTRIVVNTYESVNDCGSPNPTTNKVQTDISLNEAELSILIGALQKCRGEQ